MKKAFDLNVSRAKPRVRLGASLSELAEPPPLSDLAPDSAPEPVPAALEDEVKARAERARAPRASAIESFQMALGAAPATLPPQSEPERARFEASPVARVETPNPVIEVQTPTAPAPFPDDSRVGPEERRERLKERLRAVRENPRPEPLPASAAQAGVRAVERISNLQTDLAQLKALNLALTHDLESARRQSERATEEARLRMDEATRLSSEMEARAKLLADLEGELSSLENERDEALLSLQESKQGLDAAATERQRLEKEVAQRDQSLAESLSEEERLAAELESAKSESGTLRRTMDTLTQERDTLARQVSDLTSEVSELLEARRALEAVHRALTHATVR